MVNATQSRIVKGWTLWNGIGRKRDLISVFPLLRAEAFLALLLTKVAHLIVVKQKSNERQRWNSSRENKEAATHLVVMTLIDTTNSADS
jgi:hypothetical protein